jgi:predicted nucleic acid-binding protein
MACLAKAHSQHENSVHYGRMKNVTLSADESLIEQARLVAQARHTTLNAAFRDWLEKYASQSGGGAAVDALMRRLRHVRSSGSYTRDEMNERYIFVYTFDAQAPAKAKKAAGLIRRAADTGDGIVSYQIVQEFFNVALRRFSQPMTAAEAEQYLVTVFRPLLAVHSSPAIYIEALRISSKHRLAWYDSLVVAGALEGHCKILYSEDFQDGREIEGLQIENPFA